MLIDVVQLVRVRQRLPGTNDPWLVLVALIHRQRVWHCRVKRRTRRDVFNDQTPARSTLIPRIRELDLVTRIQEICRGAKACAAAFGFVHNLDRPVFQHINAVAASILSNAVTRKNGVGACTHMGGLHELDFQRAPVHLERRVVIDLDQVINTVKRRPPANRGCTVDVFAILRPVTQSGVEDWRTSLIKVVQCKYRHRRIPHLNIKPAAAELSAVSFRALLYSAAARHSNAVRIENAPRQRGRL